MFASTRFLFSYFCFFVTPTSSGTHTHTHTEQCMARKITCIILSEDLCDTIHILIHFPSRRSTSRIEFLRKPKRNNEEKAAAMHTAQHNRPKTKPNQKKKKGQTDCRIGARDQWKIKKKWSGPSRTRLSWPQKFTPHRQTNFHTNRVPCVCVCRLL